MGVIRSFTKNAKSGIDNRQTDKHHDLETEWAQCADTVKSASDGTDTLTHRQTDIATLRLIQPRGSIQ